MIRPESDAVLGGFAESMHLLEFDKIQKQLAGYTRTVMGKEATLSLTPSVDLLDISSRQQETSEARQFLSQGGNLEVGPDVDFRESIHRGLLGGLLSGEELYALGGLAQAARYNQRAIPKHKNIPLLSSLANNLPDVKALEQAINSAISPAGDVLDHASSELSQLRHEARQIQHRLKQVMDRNLRRWQRMDLIQEPIVTQRNGRMVLLIKAEMRSRVLGIIHDVSDSGSTVFVEPMPAIELGNRWREALLDEEREEARVLRHLSALVGGQGQDLLMTLDLLARLDLAIAKGRYSDSIHAVSPSVIEGTSQTSPLRMVQARHPLLSSAVVPISLELGGAKPVMLITGPNAGGKTVTLKTVGLLSMMAQAGLHVPAEEAHLPCFDGIYVDIGDHQSIERSLSTFSSHITNLLTFMSRSTAKSLLLVDELGTSTDPEEGAALAKAFLSYFQRRGLLMVATTHHRSVAHYVQEQQGMINASVDLDPDSLGPTYHVTLGLPGRSYAMTIAARMGLHPDIVEHAKQNLSLQDLASEELLKGLQEERSLVENLRRDTEAALIMATKQQAAVEEKLASIETTKIELLEEARSGILTHIDCLITRLQKIERSLDWPDAATSLKEDQVYLAEARRQISSPEWEPIKVQPATWKETLQRGDWVFIRGIGRPVEVITPPDEHGQLEVLLGTMRSKVPVYRLERQAEARTVTGQQSVYFHRPDHRNASTEIDIRGLHVDTGIIRIDTALNDSALDGAISLRIIHGKGTGALRQAVREYLEDHPLVASIKPGEGVGGDGVTTVELISLSIP